MHARVRSRASIPIGADSSRAIGVEPLYYAAMTPRLFIRGAYALLAARYIAIGFGSVPLSAGWINSIPPWCC
jgi:hypothetical protein